MRNGLSTNGEDHGESRARSFCDAFFTARSMCTRERLLFVSLSRSPEIARHRLRANDGSSRQASTSMEVRMQAMLFQCDATLRPADRSDSLRGRPSLFHSCSLNVIGMIAGARRLFV